MCTKTSLFRSFAGGVWLFVTLQASGALTWENLQVGGFASQGFLHSEAKDYLGESNEQPFPLPSLFPVLLGKRVTLGDARVVTVIAKAGEAQENFLQSHVAMTSSPFQNHGRRLFMTGGGSAPKVVETEADAVTLAADTPGALALGDSAALTGLALLVN